MDHESNAVFSFDQEGESDSPDRLDGIADQYSGPHMSSKGETPYSNFIIRVHHDVLNLDRDGAGRKRQKQELHYYCWRHILLP